VETPSVRAQCSDCGRQFHPASAPEYARVILARSKAEGGYYDRSDFRHGAHWTDARSATALLERITDAADCDGRDLCPDCIARAVDSWEPSDADLAGGDGSAGSDPSYRAAMRDAGRAHLLP